jgi:hypothetical protein
MADVNSGLILENFSFRNHPNSTLTLTGIATDPITHDVATSQPQTMTVDFWHI